MSKLAVELTDGNNRRELAIQARKMIASSMDIVEENEISLMSSYNEFHVLISFSDVHPLIMISFVRRIDQVRVEAIEACNRMNLTSVLGSHAFNDDATCYTYRSTHWLDTELTKSRFFEILNRCVAEANRCFKKIC